MGNPKTVSLSPENRSSGIRVVYTKSRRTLLFFGWYDNFVGIEGMEMSLADFFQATGITEADCRAVFQSQKGGK